MVYVIIFLSVLVSVLIISGRPINIRITHHHTADDVEPVESPAQEEQLRQAADMVSAINKLMLGDSYDDKVT